MSKIVWIGTSVTKGTSYGGVTTADTYAYKIGVSNGYAPADIINKGVNSDTSAGMLSRLATDVLACSPAVCVVECLINDWATGVPLATYQANITAIFAALNGASIRPVGMITSFQRGPTADFLALQPYLRAFEDIATAAGAPLVDFYREMALSSLYCTEAQFNSLFVDNVHLTVGGHIQAWRLATRARYNGVFV